MLSDSSAEVDSMAASALSDAAREDSGPGANPLPDPWIRGRSLPMPVDPHTTWIDGGRTTRVTGLVYRFAQPRAYVRDS